jgi:hypothetical protein
MKILFTGSTAKQVDDNAWERARVKRIDDSSIICSSLRKQGHIVDRKRIKWGEDLSMYDLAIVGVGCFGSNNYSGDIFNSLYALSSCKNVLVFYEDWKIESNISSFNSMLKKGVIEEAVNKKWSNGSCFYGGVDNENFNIEKAKEIIKNLTNGFYDALIPAFDWGNKEIVRKIIKSKNIYNIDLTPYVLENWNIDLRPEIKEKRKEFMLASLVDHRRWVKKCQLRWDVVYYGAKSIKESIKLETETDVYNECGKYWGILCPEYPHAGSGWFRIRYIYAALQRSIIFGSDSDLKELGIQWKRLEFLTDDELKEYAEEQRKAIFKYAWNKEIFDKKIIEIINHATNN